MALCVLVSNVLTSCSQRVGVVPYVMLHLLMLFVFSPSPTTAESLQYDVYINVDKKSHNFDNMNFHWPVLVVMIKILQLLILYRNHKNLHSVKGRT